MQGSICKSANFCVHVAMASCVKRSKLGLRNIVMAFCILCIALYADLLSIMVSRDCMNDPK